MWFIVSVPSVLESKLEGTQKKGQPKVKVNLVLRVSENLSVKNLLRREGENLFTDPKSSERPKGKKRKKKGGKVKGTQEAFV